MMAIRGLTFLPMVFNVWMKGVTFVGFFSYGNARKLVLAISEIYELYDIWWGWGYGGWLSIGALRIQRMSGLS